MLNSSASFSRALFASLLAIGLLLFLIVVTALGLVRKTSEETVLVIGDRQIRTRLSALRSALQDTEIGQRGFLLTDQETYLAPYRNGVADTAALLAELSPLLMTKVDKAKFEDVVSFANEKIGEVKSTLTLAQSGRKDEALALVDTDRGKIAMDRFRAAIAELIARADSRLQTNVDNLRNASRYLAWVTSAGAVIILATMLGAGWLILRYTRALTSAKSEIEVLNSDLEGRVAERTSALTRVNEEVQRFAYIVSHDLRAPLVNIMGFTSELDVNVPVIRDYLAKQEANAGDPDYERARRAADEDIPEALRFIRVSSTKMDGLINAILKLSREGRRTLRAEPIDSQALMTACAESVAATVSKNDGEVIVSKDIPAIISDRLALEQVFSNLVDNAIKYRHKDRPLRIELRGFSEPTSVVFEVEDNGRGIAPQDHGRIFELFRRSGIQDTSGEGIGLANVRALVRRLGGEIYVTSELGRGSVFRIKLPKNPPREADYE